MKGKPSGRLGRFWQGWIKPLAAVAIVVTTFRSAVADWNDVPTGSMRPSIVEGDRIFVNKLAYDLRVPFTSWRLAEWSRPQRGDVVVFFGPQDGKRMVKRVVGLPGETIEMRNNLLSIDGRAVRYEALDDAPVPTALQEVLDGRPHPVRFTPWAPAMRSFGPVEIPAGHCFLMGDNRDDSHDSRYFGPVSERLIAGRASTVVFSTRHGDRFLRRIP